MSGVGLKVRLDGDDLRLEEHARGEQRGLVAPGDAVVTHLPDVALPIGDPHRVAQQRALARRAAVVHRARAWLGLGLG
eukprot:scaffold56727_cov40-Phaeocystis_antarctica.AAC.4